MAKNKHSGQKIDFSRAERYCPSAEQGLTAGQVESRKQEGYVNFDATVPTRSIRKIILGNTLSVFNFVNLVLAAALLYVGSYKNTAFMGVILANIAIGIFQEVRAKRATDKLSFVSQSKAEVVRDGQLVEIPVQEIVLDDILQLSTGAQISADCIVMDGECEMNEAFVTGESEAVFKKPGDLLLSGSFVTSGSCRARADRIADCSYISSISKGAKTIKETTSILMKSLRRLITVISIVIFPIGALMFYEQFTQSGGNLTEAVVRTSASLLGMIPQGLMLLTSTALALSVVRLARKKVLVKDLYCIEMLARVDTVCLDKTGTLTEGTLQYRTMVPWDQTSPEEAEKLLAQLASALGRDNATMQAIAESFPHGDASLCTGRVAFSSKTKWSGAIFSDNGSVVLGAAEYLMPGDARVLYQSRRLAEENRVLLLAKTAEPIVFGKTPQNLIPLAFVLLCDKIRPEAADLISYFGEQGINVRIISGDNPITVSAIAKETGVPRAENYIDCSQLFDDKSVRDAAGRYTVFGRVTPQQKSILIRSIKEAGHTVAMTGDGVNDVLAMREADCSVAMGSGTDAARNIASMVLLQSDFSTLPSVIYEGRRSVNNIQRSGSLFLVKTIYSALLAVLMLCAHWMYPFQPIQQSLVSLLGIGIPSFVLALEPNHNRISGSFFRNILLQSLPGGLTMTVLISAILILACPLNLSHQMVSTMSVAAACFISVLVLLSICFPPNRLARILITFCVSGFMVGMLGFPKLLGLVKLDAVPFAVLIALVACGVFLMDILARLVQKYRYKNHARQKKGRE